MHSVASQYKARCCGFLVGALLLSLSTAFGSVVVREELESGVYAAIRGGNVLFLECSPPQGNQAQDLLEQYLANSDDWRLYKDRLAVAIPFARLNPDSQRKILKKIFPLDYVDAAGWWHTVRFADNNGAESLSALAEWLTGSSQHLQQILAHDANHAVREPLSRGDRILIPQPLLLPVMKTHSPQPPPPLPPIVPAPTPEPDVRTTLAMDTEATESVASLILDNGNGLANGVLEYGEDNEGPYALYRLEPGESLYSAVVVRFTDYRENADIQQACRIIQERSGIRNVHRMRAGQPILIPLDMLSDRYQPSGSEPRQAWEAIRAEARRLREQRIGTKDLDGVVVVLDAGHGGRDHGAALPHLGLYEDQINYDIVSRIKYLLETRTRARVYVTVYNRQKGFNPTDATRFSHTTNEVLLTTPNYTNDDARVSANLRWYLANDIFYRELERGTDERKIIFASIHCDALFNQSLRGAMVYVPGAQYRRDSERPSGTIYNHFDEVRRNPTATSTASQRTRDEALSRNFALTLLQTMRTNDPPLKVHDAGDPIRNVIRQSRGRAYLPAVLRNTAIPTKVLVEVANMTNPTDQQHLANPRWRQWFAEAFVDALRNHFNDN